MLKSLLVLLLISTRLFHLCSCVQRPELLLEGSTQSGGTFCPGETAQLKCIFPEGERALEWYVNDSERPFDVDFLAEDLPGHNATTPFGNYTIVSIFKKDPYRSNYSCAVKLPGSDARSNSVEVLFEDTEPDGITATCTSSDSDSITVAVNYTNGCRRETVVASSGMVCKPLLTAPAMMIFTCGALYPNTSYNITADSNGHSDSITCSTIVKQIVYLAFLGVLVLVVTGFGVVLGTLLHRYRKRQHGLYSTQDQHQLESKVEDACHSVEVLRTSAEAQFSDHPSVDRSPFDSKVPKTLLRSDSESRERTNSANPLLAQHQVDDHDHEMKYAVLDHSGPRPIPAPSPHEKVNYAAIKLEQ